MGIPQNEWIIRENSTKMDDLGVPRFQETPKWRDSRVKTGRFKHPEAKRSFRSCFWMMFHMNSSLLGDFFLDFRECDGTSWWLPKSWMWWSHGIAKTWKPVIIAVWWFPGWWFGTFFIFPYIGNNHPNWLSYFSEGFKPPTSFNILIGMFFSGLEMGWWFEWKMGREFANKFCWFHIQTRKCWSFNMQRSVAWGCGVHGSVDVAREILIVDGFASFVNYH